MKKYYVNNNEQSNGDHEVHNQNCFYLPLIKSKTDLGYHHSCNSAVAKAKQIYSHSNGCFYCSNECHTS